MSVALNRILVVDDEPGIRLGLGSFLRSHGFQVVEAASAVDAEDRFRDAQPSLTILDYGLPDQDGMSTLARLRRIDARALVVMLTGYGTIELAVKAIKAGAEHLLTKPVDLKELLKLIRGMLTAKSPVCTPAAPNPFAGASRAIRELEAQAERVAGSDHPTLILGETGAGKGVLARWLHERGPRQAAPFVDLNCAGFSRDLLESELFGHERGAFTGAVGRKQGLFEAADKGALFLDEIGELELSLQPKLLKAVEEKRFRRVGDVRPISVNVRLIAATNSDLPARVRDGSFRADLYFRMSTVVLSIPPLRERSEDVAPLARTLLCAMDGANPPELSADAIARLEEHDWPGNIRELGNVLERARLYTKGGAISARDIIFDRNSQPAAPVAPLSSLDEMERTHIERAMVATSGRVDEAAAILGIPRSTLYHKLKRQRRDSKNETR